MPKPRFIIWITYFNTNGKYYANGNYLTDLQNMPDIIDEFTAMLARGKRPGLTSGHSGYHAVLDCSDHPDGYPVMFPGKA